MDIASSIGVLFGSSWASGVNLYMTTAVLGICERMHVIDLPGELKIVAHPLIILAAVLLYAVEFIADKIPLVDHAWDSIHTIVRPLAGATIGYLAVSQMGPVAQTLTGLVTGGIAASSHLTKSSSRVAVNATMIPGAGVGASLVEDVAVGGMLYLIVQHPIIAGAIVILLVILAIWLLRAMFRMFRKVFSFKPTPKQPAVQTG